MKHESIITGEVHGQCLTGEIKTTIRKNAAKHGIIWLGEISVSEEPALKPRVNQGRWIIDCPDCPSAEFMDETDVFMCQSCWNVSNERKYRAVKQPSNRASIEHELLKRPDPINRNWTNETITKLRSENAEHGV
jgi:hypothetical protein